MESSSSVVPFRRIKKLDQKISYEEPNKVSVDDKTEAISPEELFALVSEIFLNKENKGVTQEGIEMENLHNDKYIDQRFKNIEDKLDHKIEMVSQKIDTLTNKISDNTNWMKTLVDHTMNEVTAIKNDGKQTRIHIWGSVIALFVGLAAILVAINGMQNNWLQEYIRIITEAFAK